MKKLPILILGLYLPGMSLLRNFSKRGILSFGADCENAEYGFLTKFGKKYLCPDPKESEEKWLEFMFDFAGKIKEKTVLLTTSDRFVLPISKYRDELKKYFTFILPKHNLLEKLTSKKGIYDLAVSNNLSVPKTIFPNELNEIEEKIKKMEFPLIIKPYYSKDWFKKDVANYVKHEKVMVVKNIYELKGAIIKMREFNVPILIQEIVKGNDENLFYHVSYTNSSGKVILSFIGKKRRITPVHFGSASYVEIIKNDKLNVLANNFLENIEYMGVCGIEFKYDSEKNDYYLIEINPRFGLWDEIGEKINKDVGWYYYLDAIGECPKENFSKDKFMSYYWVSLHRDIAAFFEYKQKQELSFLGWISTYFVSPLFISDIKLNDPKITLLTFYKVLRKILGYIIRKFKV